MKKIIVLFIVFVFNVDLYATKHNHFDENEIRYIKEDMVLDPVYQSI